MKAVLRSLLILLLLFALPFQGVAASGMMACVPAAVHGAAMTTPGHDHAAMLHASQGHEGKQHDGRHDDGRHGNGSCASCCIGAAIAPAMQLQLDPARPEFIAIPFRPGHLPSVDPAHPERPPRSFMA